MGSGDGGADENVMHVLYVFVCIELISSVRSFGVGGRVGGGVDNVRERAAKYPSFQRMASMLKTSSIGKRKLFRMVVRSVFPSIVLVLVLVLLKTDIEEIFGGGSDLACVVVDIPGPIAIDGI